MDNDLLELVGKLLDQTRVGKMMWEDVSTHSGGERFRLNFGDAIVAVENGDRKVWSDKGEEHFVPEYRLKVLDSRGFVVAEMEHYAGMPFDQLSELFQLARSGARNRRQVISALLERISR